MTAAVSLPDPDEETETQRSKEICPRPGVKPKHLNPGPTPGPVSSASVLCCYPDPHCCMPLLHPTLTCHCQKVPLRSNSKPQHVTKGEDSKPASVSISNRTSGLSSNQKDIENGEQRGHRKPEPRGGQFSERELQRMSWGVSAPEFKFQLQRFLCCVASLKPMIFSVLSVCPCGKEGS